VGFSEIEVSFQGGCKEEWMKQREDLARSVECRRQNVPKKRKSMAKFQCCKSFSQS